MSTTSSSTVSDVKKEKVDPKVNHELRRRDERRQQMIQRSATEAFAQFQSHIMSNSTVLEHVRKTHGVFLKYDEMPLPSDTPDLQRMGTWVVVFWPNSAERFRFMLNKTMMNRRLVEVVDVLFDWKDACVFLPISMMMFFVKHEKDFEKLFKNGKSQKLETALNKEVSARRMHDTVDLPDFAIFQHLDIELINNMVKTMKYTNAHTRIPTAFLFVDTQSNAAIVECGIAAEVDKICADKKGLLHLSCMIFEYLFSTCSAERNLELLLNATEDGLKPEEQRALRSETYMYANKVLDMNKAEMLKHMDVERAERVFSGSEQANSSESLQVMRHVLDDGIKVPCGYCQKELERDVSEKCPQCNIFCYCDKKCLRRHYKKGAFIEKKPEPDTGVIMLTHSVVCPISRSIARLLAQYPEDITEEEHMEAAKKANEKLMECAKRGVKVTVAEETNSDPVEEAVERARLAAEKMKIVEEDDDDN